MAMASKNKNTPLSPELILYKQNLIIELLRDSKKEGLNLGESCHEKIYKTILLTHDDDKNRSGNPFESSSMLKDALSYDDQKTLQQQLDSIVLRKFPKVIQNYDDITDGYLKEKLKNSNTCSTGLSEEQTKLLELTNEYLECLNKSNMLNSEMFDMMKEWVDIRLGPIVSAAEETVEVTAAKNKLLALKAKIINVQTKLVFYSQKSNPITAYSEVHNDIMKQFDQYKGEISNYKRIINTPVESK